MDELRQPAVEMLKQELGSEFADWYEKRRSAHGDDWYLPDLWHFRGGMHVRNLLREKGFGEKYFGVSNIDDVYISLVEEAMDD